ncbi:MAG: cysteine desulfurase family protein, partial [Bacteroidota bacterium]
ASYQISRFLNLNKKQDLRAFYKGIDQHFVFTSGSTESINLVFKGLSMKFKKGHIITSKTEHKAVISTCNYLSSIGFEVTFLDVNEEGLIDEKELINAIKADTFLISIMWANNETGVVQDINRISEIAREHDILFFTDATAAAGKVNIDLDETPVDFLCFSGHKIHGPKGTGVLYINKNNPRTNFSPQIHGGEQQNNMRSGTLNIPGIVGTGVACEILNSNFNNEIQRVKHLRDLLEEKLLRIPGVYLNGSKIHRTCNVANICFSEVETDNLIIQSPNIAVSTGSACNSQSNKASHVLTAMGFEKNRLSSSIRFSLGRFNTIREIEEVYESYINHYQNSFNHLLV